MDKKIWISVVLIIFATLIGVIIFNTYKNSKIEIINEREQASNEIIEKPKITLNTKHQYSDGVHTYIGSFETPTPCYTYNAVVEENDGQKIIAITYEQEEGVCAQVVDKKDFKVSFEGSPEESVIATLNGEVVNLNIFEVPDNQNIEDFEIFIKG